MNLDMIAEVLADSGYVRRGISRTVPEGIELGERHKPDLAAIYPHLANRGLSRARRMDWANRFLPQTMSRTASHYSTRHCISVKKPPRQALLKMLTPV